MFGSTSKYLTYLLSLILVFAIACDEETPTGTDVPSNFELDITVSEDNSGLVTVFASADNVTEFHFFMGDEIGADPIISATGQLTYTYESSGVFVIEARAYGTSGKFIKKEAQVTVVIDGGGIPDDGYTTPPAYDGMTLIWSDEFNGNGLDESNWTYEIGTGSNGWGNNELQYYRQENTFVDNGYLTIEARKETFGGKAYTSSRLITMNKFDFKYGRVDIRAKLPKGQGLWPALWMLGSNFSSVGWPSCGEIDIMELVGGSSTDNKVHGTIHWDNNGSKADYGKSYTLNSGIFNDKFHVFSLIWDSNELKWYVDDQLFLTADITPAALSEFQNEFFFIFNVAVGGNWPGSPNSSTEFPQQMNVDYVRVFQPN